MRVAITGTLSQPRRTIIKLIEAKTSASFSDNVTWDTDYLVAARFDTNKARRAAAIGVTVISEADLMLFLESGRVPPTKLPHRPKVPHVIQFPDITWTDHFDPERTVLLTYRDAHGAESQRFVTLTCMGLGSNGVEYFGGYDIECFKTFRKERVLAMEECS